MKLARANRVRGLTLFEVVISIALIALLLGALLTFFWQTLEIRDAAAKAADRTQIVEQVLTRMAEELRGTLAADQVGFPVQRFIGERRKITFLSTPLPPRSSYAFYRESEVRPVPETDLREITYELWIDPEKTTDEGDPLIGGILRTERRAIDPSLSQDEITEDQDLLYKRHDLWAPELGYLEFRYFDGAQWSTSWNVAKGNPLPQLMQITVGFDSLTRDALEDQDLQNYPLDQYPLGPDKPNINRYSMMVRLPAADVMFTSRIQNLNAQAGELYSFVQPQGATGASGPKSEGTGGGP